MSYEKFLNSPALAAIKKTSMAKAAPKWAALPLGFRRLLCRQADVALDNAARDLGEIDMYDAEKLYRANKALAALCEAARDPLLCGAIKEARPRNRLFRP